MNFGDTVKVFVNKLSESVRVGLVFGEPIETHGKTVIPVASYGFGFGMGGDFNEGSEEAAESKQSGGGGGGGGVHPMGVFEISELYTRFVPAINFREVLISLTIICVHYNFYRIVKTVLGKKKKA